MTAEAETQNDSRVLYVEDDLGHIRLVQRAFETQLPEIELLIAGTLAEAKQIIAQTDPLLIIADYRLPDGLGTELTENQGSNIPVVVLTSQGSETVAVDAMKRGVLDYIIKSDETLRSLPQVAGRALREWKLQQEKRQMQRLLQVLLDSMPYRVYVTDKDWDILLANQRHFTNDIPIDIGHLHQEDNFLQKCRMSEKLEAARIEVVNFLNSIPDSLAQTVEVEFQLRRDSEPSQWFRILVAPIWEVARARYLIQLEEISERKQEEMKSQETAIHLARYESLSPREREVIQMVADGDPNKVIASRLHLSDRTVEKHRAAGMKKLKVRSVADLVKVVVAVQASTA